MPASRLALALCALLLSSGADAQTATADAEATYRRLLAGPIGPRSQPFAEPDPADRAATHPVIDDARGRERLERGRRFESEGRVSEARREYEAVLPATRAGRWLLNVGIGRLAQVDGDLRGAIDAFRQALASAPNEAFIHRELAAALMAAGQIEPAFAELIAALTIDPGDAPTLADIGQLYLDTDRPAEAVTAFNRALQAAPERFESRYGLAAALTRLGRAAEAARELRLFERARREMVERRRRELDADVKRQEAIDEAAGR